MSKYPVWCLVSHGYPINLILPNTRYRSKSFGDTEQEPIGGKCWLTRMPIVD